MTVPSSVVELVQAASAAMKAGDNYRANEILTRIVSTAPDWGPGHIEFGMFLVRAGKTDDGLMRLRQACRCRPVHANPFLATGAVEFNLGKHERARRHFRRALLIDPTLPAAVVQFARASLRGGYVAEVGRVLTVNPALPWMDVNAFHLLAQSLNRSEEPERARSAGFRGGVAFPNDAVTLCFLANILLRNEEKQFAYELARRASVVAPNALDVLRVLSEIALFTDHPQVAANAAAHSLRLSDKPDTRFMLGRALLGLGQVNSAERHLEAANRHHAFREKTRILLMTARQSDFHADSNEVS